MEYLPLCVKQNKIYYSNKSQHVFTIQNKLKKRGIFTNYTYKTQILLQYQYIYISILHQKYTCRLSFDHEKESSRINGDFFLKITNRKLLLYQVEIYDNNNMNLPWYHNVP